MPADDDRPAGWWRAFAEAGNPFDVAGRDPSTLDEYRSVYTACLESYEHHCAVTGIPFAPAEGVHPNLQVQAIRPLYAEGRLEVRNFLPMIQPVATAFRAGQFTIGADGKFIGDPGTIEPGLLDVLRRRVVLLPPIGPAAAPDPLALAYHRDVIFTGSRD